MQKSETFEELWREQQQREIDMVLAARQLGNARRGCKPYEPLRVPIAEIVERQLTL